MRSEVDRALPGVAIPPGELLGEELEARGMSQMELARKMERPVQVVNEIIRGLKAITPETALQLKQVLGTPAYVWVRLEADYRLDKARLKAQPEEQTRPAPRQKGRADRVTQYASRHGISMARAAAARKK